MELSSQRLHLLPGQQRAGWDGEPVSPGNLSLRRPSDPPSTIFLPPLLRPASQLLPQDTRTRRQLFEPEPVVTPQMEASVTTEPEPKDTAREMVSDIQAIGNMAAMLLAIDRWSDGGIPRTAWQLANRCHQTGLLPILSHPRMVETIDQLLQQRNHNHRPCLLTVAADNFAEIRSRTSRWPDFDLDGLEQVHQSGPSVTTAAQLQLQVEEWPQHLVNQSKYSAPEVLTGWAEGETLKIPNLVGIEGTARSRLERDSRGLVMGTYQLQIGETWHSWDDLSDDETEESVRPLRVEVRVTHLPSDYRQEWTLQDLVSEHQTQAASFTSIPHDQHWGYEFHCCRCRGSTQSIRPIQGARNGDATVTAIQAVTDLQINKSTPLNLTARTIAVVRLRSLAPQAPGEPYQMYERLNGKVWFNNLIEVLVNGQPVFATMTTPADMRGASD